MQGPKGVVASLAAAAGGVLATQANSLSRFKSKMALHSRMSSFPSTSRDTAADELFLVIQKEDPSRKFVRAINEAPQLQQQCSHQRKHVLDLYRGRHISGQITGGGDIRKFLKMLLSLHG